MASKDYLRVVSAPEDVLDGHDLDNERSFGDGNGGGGNVTERLERLEKKVDSIESVLSRLNESMIRIEGKFEVIALKFDAIDNQFDNTKKSITEKIESSNKIQNDKIDSSAKLNESNTRAIVAEAKLAIILAIPAIIGAAYTAYRLLSKQ